MKLDKILDDAKNYLNDDLSSYKELMKIQYQIWNVSKEEVDADKVLYAVLKAVANAKPEEIRVEVPVEAKEENKVHYAKVENAQRFFINLGAVDDLSGEKLASILAPYTDGLKPKDFADIYICGTYSFFELDKKYADAILEGVPGTIYNDREIRVELSEKKSGERKTPRKEFSRDHRDSKGRGFNDKKKSFSRDHKSEQKRRPSRSYK